MMVDGKQVKPCDVMTYEEFWNAVRKDALEFIKNEERAKNVDDAMEEFRDDIENQFNSIYGSISACGWNVGMWM